MNLESKQVQDHLHVFFFTVGRIIKPVHIYELFKSLFLLLLSFPLSLISTDEVSIDARTLRLKSTMTTSDCRHRGSGSQEHFLLTIAS